MSYWVLLGQVAYSMQKEQTKHPKPIQSIFLRVCAKNSLSSRIYTLVKEYRTCNLLNQSLKDRISFSNVAHKAVTKSLPKVISYAITIIQPTHL